jgi:hypothetical protein
MKIYAIEEAAVKPAETEQGIYNGIVRELDLMRTKLEGLRNRLEAAANRLLEHNDLCSGCQEFSSDCLVVDHEVPTIDGTEMTTEVLCAGCRQEVA